MANNRKNPPAKWVLPDVIDPPRICFTVPVPNDRKHIAAFRGALYNLTSARFWQDDLAHTALLVAKVWQDIYDEVIACTEPIPDNQGVSLDEDISMQIRLNPDDPCVIQMWCIDHWENWYDPRVCGPVASQPGGGDEATAHPEPGSCDTYHAQMRANSQWIAPFVVNAGDVITMSHGTGAGHDPALVQWNCIGGRTYFAGDCVGFSVFSAGDQLSTAYHMQLIMNVDGVWYDAFTPLTVPSGVSNSPVLFQINVPAGALAVVDGSYTFDVEQCNNAPVTWCQEFDFSLSNYGWYADAGSYGTYVVGVGWQSDYVPSSARLSINVAFSSSTITSVRVVGSAEADPSTGAHGVYIHSGVDLYGSLPTSLGDFDVTIDNVQSGITNVQVAYGANPAGPTDVNQITKVVICGNGTNPFEA